MKITFHWVFQCENENVIAFYAFPLSLDVNYSFVLPWGTFSELCSVLPYIELRIMLTCFLIITALLSTCLRKT